MLTPDNAIEKAGNLISHSKRIVAFTGAGISTDSGIPDLSGIDRILKDDPYFTGDVFNLLSSSFATHHPEEFYRLYRKTFFQPNAQPNEAHHFLASLEQTGKLVGIATMNIDWLHQLAGSQTVFEYWGDMHKNHCVYCQRSFDWQIIKEMVLPKCPSCGHVIIPDFVMRNLATYQDAVAAGQALIAQADLLLIIGTKRSPNQFPQKTPKIIINEYPVLSGGNNFLEVNGRASVVFSKINQYLRTI